MSLYKPKVTALVPSFNHGRYLRQRIESILGQTYDNIELVVVDDCSEDDSDSILQSLQNQYGFQYIRNTRNSGTPFAAWENILTIAQGEYIWICESDDYAEPDFLEIAVGKFSKSRDAVLFYCDSWVVDEEGNRIDHTDSYFHDIWKESRWDNEFIANGMDELSGYQIRGQTVPNMSSSLISTRAFRKAYNPFLKKLKLTGDWLFVGWLMCQGTVVYCKQTLSNFRRHEITSRVRVKSARSQAEFLVTKYLLFQKTGKPLREFAHLMQTDAVRFLYEPANLVEVIKALLKISPLKSFALAVRIFLSVVMNPHYMILFYRRYIIAKRS